MTNDALESLKYPVGKFRFPENIPSSILKQWTERIARFPREMTELVSGLSDKQLDTPYRPDGWNIRQVVHHVGDSHMGSYTRFKWALTEDNPMIKTYDQDKWSDLPDTKFGPIKEALDFLTALHSKWVTLLHSLSSEQWERTFQHPEMKRTITLKQNLALYVWHCDHHYAHIKQLLISKGWL